MLRTTNYDLCQYQGSDKTSYLVNYNEDMLKIDTAIAAAKSAADLAQTTANGADGKADSVAGDVSTLNAQINGPSGIAADLVTAQGAINTINSLIGDGEPTTTNKTLIGAINEIAAEIPSGELAADHVTYDNTTSGLTADDVQEAIDELAQAGAPTASAVSYDNTDSGLTADDVQEAIDELASKSVSVELDTANKEAFTTQAGTYTAAKAGVMYFYTSDNGTISGTAFKGISGITFGSGGYFCSVIMNAGETFIAGAGVTPDAYFVPFV